MKRSWKSARAKAVQSAATSSFAPSKYGARTGASFICTGHCDRRDATALTLGAETSAASRFSSREYVPGHPHGSFPSAARFAATFASAAALS